MWLVHHMLSLWDMKTAWTNVRYAARTLRKSPVFSLTIIVVLALGIGSNVGIFTVLNAVLLRPLPFEHPERLMLLIGNIQRTNVERRGGSLPDYRDWKEQNRSFDGLASYWGATFTLRGADERVAVQGEIVGSQYFNLLGIKPVLGREFRPEEETDTVLPPVIILGHDFWVRQLGSNPGVLGTQVALDAANYTIVGVMPRGFHGLLDRAEVWIPPASLPSGQQSFRERGTRGLNVLGRLREGVTRVQAQAEMDNISRALERTYLENEKRGVEVASLVQETVGPIRPPLFALLGAVGLVLLIACANVANLLLVRMERRYPEIALRTALGASRRELLRIILTENLLVSFIGAGIALLVSGWAIDLILASSPIQLPSFINVGVDLDVVLFTLGLAFLTDILVAIAPAMHFAPSNLHETLNSNSTKTTGARSSKRFRDALVVSEVAVSFVLLLGAGLLIESFRQLLRVDPGFETSRLLTVRLGLDREADVNGLTVKESLEHLPGVKSVALSSVIPFSGGPALSYTVEGQPSMDAASAPRAYFHQITEDFFRTMGIPLVRGRDFKSDEGTGSVIVSEKVVQRFWPGEDPIGKRIKNGRNDPTAPWLNVVGVVGDTKTRGLPDNPTADPDLYYPFSSLGGPNIRNLGVLIRTDGEPSLLVPTFRNAIKQLDKMALISNIATMEELIRPRMARQRFLSGLSGAFSGMALVLALVGIYGALSFTVAQRTREIGIRIAVGARPPDIFRMVLGPALALIGAGLAIGLVGGVLVGRGISALLFGVRVIEPSVFITVSALMVVTGLSAAYLPARRAVAVDPVRALREE